jgi:hypothetical protein
MSKKNYERRETVYKVVIYYNVGWDPCGRHEKECSVERFIKKAEAEEFFEQVSKTRYWDDKSQSTVVNGTLFPFTRRHVSGAYLESVTTTRIKTMS